MVSLLRENWFIAAFFEVKHLNAALILVCAIIRTNV